MKKITLIIALLISSLGFAQNLLRDGDFENLDPGSGGQALGSVVPVSPLDPTDNKVFPWTSNYAANKCTINTNPTLDPPVYYPHGGSNYITMPNDYSLFRQPFTAVVGTSYTVKFWVMFIGGQGLPNASDGMYASIKSDDGTNNGNGSALSTPITLPYIDPSTFALSSWNEVTYTFTATQTNLLFHIYKLARKAATPTAPNNGARLDDFSIVTTPLSVKDFAQFSFKSYPNPVTNQLNLSANKNIDSVSFFNVLGQKVQSNTINAAQKQLDISNLQNGVYMMEVTIDNAKQAYKIVKQ